MDGYGPLGRGKINTAEHHHIHTKQDWDYPTLPPSRPGSPAHLGYKGAFDTYAASRPIGAADAVLHEIENLRYRHRR
eukprot:1257942-Pyramimonas_sp.AAC.1